MKSFDRITAVFIVLMAAFFLTVNAVLLKQNRSVVPLYRVEANRIEQELLNGRQVSADDYADITEIFEYDGSDDFYSSENEYLIREINSKLYRIEYTDKPQKSSGILIAVDIVLGVFTLIMAAAFIYIRQRILKPFNELSSLPEQLSKKISCCPLRSIRASSSAGSSGDWICSDRSLSAPVRRSLNTPKTKRPSCFRCHMISKHPFPQ